MKQDSSEYESKSKQIRELASLGPEQFISHLSQLHNTLDEAAPGIAPQVYAAANNSVQFLNSKLPYFGGELAQDESRPPSPDQQRQWLSLHKIVDQPLSIFEHLENGTLNSPQVEALQAVYPEIHAEITGQMMEELGKMKIANETIPYSKRLTISKFIGMPVDSTMTPASMQGILMAAGPNTGPVAQAQDRPRHGAAGAPALKQAEKVTQSYRTPSQALALDKNRVK